MTEMVGHIYVNGFRIDERTELKLFDRVVFGHSAYFLYGFELGSETKNKREMFMMWRNMIGHLLNRSS